MTAIEAIMKRRSVRKFTGEPVTKETVMQLIDAAAAAPSAMNLRPVRFILMDKHERGYTGGTGWLEDASAALENILIAATALGLGSLWYGVYRRAAKEPQVRAALNLPEGAECAGIAVIGHAAEEHKEHGRVDGKFVFEAKWSK